MLGVVWFRVLGECGSGCEPAEDGPMGFELHEFEGFLRRGSYVKEEQIPFYVKWIKRYLSTART